MSQTVRKASNRAYRTRSGAGLGMGSVSTFQALVGRPIASVQIADERLGFVRVSAVSEGRGVCSVSPAGQADSGLGVRVRNNAPVNAPGDARGTFPPPPYRWRCGGLPKLFPAFSAGL